jgi:hypothetical protein
LLVCKNKHCKKSINTNQQKMNKNIPAVPVLFDGIRNKVLVAIFVFVVVVSITSPILGRKTEAATSSTINFQARLLQGNGAVVADGYYNVEFKLYDVSTSGAALWTETRYDSNGVSAGNDNRVRVVNGYLTANLGSVSAFPSINWDQELWLTMNIGGTAQTASPAWDGEMNPRLKFTASPYAFAAGKLQTSSGVNTSTLGFASQTASRSLLLPDESGTLCVQSSAACGFAASSGSNSYIQNGTGVQTADFNITGNGTIGTRLNLTGAGSGNGIVIGLDTDLYRSAANTLRTSGNLEVEGLLEVSSGTTLGTAGGATAVTILGASSGNILNLIPGTGQFSDAAYININNRVGVGYDGLGNLSLGDTANSNKGVILRAASAAVATLSATNGAANFKNQANSTSAFSIQNASSQNLFVADTSSQRLAVGPAAVPGNGVLTVGSDTTAASGGLYFGTDTNLYRSTTNTLKSSGVFVAEGGIFVNQSGGPAMAGITSAGVLEFGPGNAARDVNLYRSAANTLKTDDAFEVGGNLSVTGALGVVSTANSYIMGALGLGTIAPQAGSALTIANGEWISAVDAAGTGFVNLFQVNANNEIQVGAALNIDGGIILPTNGGQLTLVDLPIDATSPVGTVHSYTLRVGTTNGLTVYGQSDGAGGTQNVRVAVGSSIAPSYTLDVTGDINISSGSVYRINGTSICSSSGCTPAAGSTNYIQNGTGQQVSSNFNISGAGVVGTTLAVNGATLSTTSATMALFNTGATTLNFGGAATAITVGAATGTATFNGKVSIGAGSVAARLAVTATNNSEAALWAQTTNSAGYGAALRAGTASVDYLNISNFGKWVVRSPGGADSADQYLFQDSTGANIIGFNAQSKRVFINSTAVGATAHALYVNGDTNLSSGSVYRINGSQISSANLSNDSSLAKLNGTNTITATSAFIVTNGGGTNALMVDTSNGRVGIQTTGVPGNYALDVGGIFQVDKTDNRLIVGTAGGSTTGVLMVLGHKTNVGDPTGVVGGMYFNSTTNSFRCYTSATTGWQDCGPQTRKLAVDASNSTTTMGDISGLGFVVAANTDYSLRCELLYESVAPSTGFVVSLTGPSSPTSVAGMLTTFNGATQDTVAGYGFTAYDGGSGVPSVTAANTPYAATFTATFRNGATAGNLIPRLKSLVATSQVTIKAGSSCQLTSL